MGFETGLLTDNNQLVYEVSEVNGTKQWMNCLNIYHWRLGKVFYHGGPSWLVLWNLRIKGFGGMTTRTMESLVITKLH